MPAPLTNHTEERTINTFPDAGNLVNTLILEASHRPDVLAAAQQLREGHLVAIPTETVYGLAADAANPAAVRRIFSAKERPIGHPLIVHLADPRRMGDWSGIVPEEAWTLAEAFWPGPLTLLLPKGERATDLITGGSDRIALRMPDHEVALDVIHALGREVVAPSANPYGRISPTTAAHVVAGLSGRIEAVLDGGACAVGLESTIIDLAAGRPRIIRPGAIGRLELETVLGVRISTEDVSGIAAPGNVKRHYQPRTPTDTHAPHRFTEEIERRIAQGERVGALWYRSPPPTTAMIASVQLPDDPRGYGQMLYAALHTLDQENLTHIIVESPPQAESWAAVHDRLQRACARN